MVFQSDLWSNGQITPVLKVCSAAKFRVIANQVGFQWDCSNANEANCVSDVEEFPHCDMLPG